MRILLGSVEWSDRCVASTHGLTRANTHPPKSYHTQCERELVLYGYVRGSHLKPGMKVHLIGAGDFDMASVRIVMHCLLCKRPCSWKTYVCTRPATHSPRAHPNPNYPPTNQCRWTRWRTRAPSRRRSGARSRPRRRSSTRPWPTSARCATTRTPCTSTSAASTTPRSVEPSIRRSIVDSVVVVYGQPARVRISPNNRAFTQPPNPNPTGRHAGPRRARGRGGERGRGGRGGGRGRVRGRGCPLAARAGAAGALLWGVVCVVWM